MKKTKQILALSITFISVFVLSAFLINKLPSNIPSSDTDYSISSFEFDNLLEIPVSDLGNDLESVDLESDIVDYSSNDKTKKYSNNYGMFSFQLNSKGKIAQFSSENIDEDEYLIKGTAEFTKYELEYSGYFLVNSDNKVMFYKGKMDLPNDDSYDGTFYTDEKNNSYKKGTYTWTNGDSYKGVFDVYTAKDKSGKKISKSCIGNSDGDKKGYYYFDSYEFEYLNIAFKNGKPYGTGTYYYLSSKYKVKYDSNGKCISSKKV